MAREWRERPLGELTDNFDGIRIPVKEVDRRPGPYPYYGASGIVDHVDGYLFDGEYLLIAEDGENLRTRTTPVAFLARGKFWVNNHAHIVRGNNQVDTRFLMYSLAGTDISGYLTGSTMPKLTQGSMNRIPLLTPPLPEQRAIAYILGTLDDKIELNRQMSETLEAMARALFKSWFVDFDPVRAKSEGRDPGLPQPLANLFPARLMDSELGEIPEGWEVGKVGDLCSAIFSGGTPNTQETSYWDGGIPWLSSGETREKVIIDTERTITEAGVSNSSTRLAPALSTVIASAGQGSTRGQTSILAFDSYINQSVVALIASPLRSSPYHLFFDLERRYDEFRRISDAHSSRGSLTTKLLAASDATLPSKLLIERFDSVVGVQVSHIITLRSESRTLAALRDALLPKLISGELRVKDAEKIIGRVS